MFACGAEEGHGGFGNWELGIGIADLVWLDFYYTALWNLGAGIHMPAREIA